LQGGEILLGDAAATEAFGRRLASVVQAGDVVALSGDLGMGKTSVARGLLAGLGLQGEAPSPSFAIVQPYQPPEVLLPVLHVDLYRIDDPAEMEELGLDDGLGDTLLVVEWPERAGVGYWPDALALTLSATADGGRRLTAEVPERWKPRWPI
jgi:tRNA threonylcarbamoyladenosine biosynthesis protein TsaE